MSGNRVPSKTIYSEISSLNVKGKSILDAGCGEGLYLDVLLNLKPKKIYAIDKSAERINNLKKIYGTKNLFFLTGNLEKLNFKDSSFDLIFCSRVLSYVNNRAALREIQRVLKRRGYLIIQTMQFGYYLRELLRGDLKRITSFINFVFSTIFNRRLFSNLDDIDSEYKIRKNIKNLVVVRKVIFEKFLGFLVYSLYILKKRS